MRSDVKISIVLVIISIMILSAIIVYQYNEHQKELDDEEEEELLEREQLYREKVEEQLHDGKVHFNIFTTKDTYEDDEQIDIRVELVNGMDEPIFFIAPSSIPLVNLSITDEDSLEVYSFIKIDYAFLEVEINHTFESNSRNHMMNITWDQIIDLYSEEGTLLPPEEGNSVPRGRYQMDIILNGSSHPDYELEIESKTIEIN